MSWIKKEAKTYVFRVTYLDEDNVIVPEKKEVQVPETVIEESRKQRSLGPIVDWIEETQDAAVYTIEEIV